MTGDHLSDHAGTSPAQARRGPIGVLLMAYGTPERPEDIEPYYTDIRGGRAPSAELLAELRGRYERVGGRTPLLDISRAQARGLQARLDAAAPGRYRVYLGMRHWKPSIADAVRAMAADGIAEALGLALAPHYSRMSIGAYIQKVEEAQTALAEEQRARGEVVAPTQFSFVHTWHDEPLFWQALAAQVRDALIGHFAEDERGRVFVLFTAHSLPERIRTWDDPYPRELDATAAGVAELLGLAPDRWDFAYQSAGRTPEPWLGPEILGKIRALAEAGEAAILVCPVGFIAEHLEILYDLDIEAQALASELGIHLERIAMLNDSPALIQALAAVVRRHAPRTSSPVL